MGVRSGIAASHVALTVAKDKMTYGTQVLSLACLEGACRLHHDSHQEQN
jgi:hypothetical protein